MKEMLMIIGVILLMPVLLPVAIIGGWFWTTDKDAAQADMK